VNLKEQKKTGVSYLRPIQIAFESPKFMLPIRLGMANARGAQDLIVYTLTKNGRVESTNYRTVMIPTGMDVPVFVKNDFGNFYQAAFQREHQKEHARAVLTEYAWNMSWCDPCSADPLTPSELRKLGVFWTGEAAYLTRLHVRYDNEHFPEDLAFQQTGDQQSFQARYVLRHAFDGAGTCPAMAQYQDELNKRHIAEAKTLAQLTGWDLASIHTKMGPNAPHFPPEPKWWERLWQ
jgi:hypothetical protein